MFKFSKSFAIALFIVVLISFGMRDYKIGLQIIMAYAIGKIIWNLLTK